MKCTINVIFVQLPKLKKESKLFRKFWRSRGTKEPAYITVVLIDVDFVTKKGAFPTDKPGLCHADSNPGLFDKNLFGLEVQVAQVESYSGLRTNKGFEVTFTSCSLVKKRPTHQVVTTTPGSLEPFLALTDAPLTVGVARTTSKALVGFVEVFVVAAPAFVIFSVKDLKLLAQVPSIPDCSQNY